MEYSLPEHFFIYKNIMTFSLEESQKNENDPYFQIYKTMYKNFFDYGFYFERPLLEKFIRRNLINAHHVLSIEGIAGCGKSTLIRKVISTLIERYYTYIIDFNVAINDPEFQKVDSKKTLKIAINNYVANNLLANFFNDYPEKMEKLIEMALFSKENKFKQAFAKQRSKLSIKFMPYFNTKKFTSKLKWFREQKDENADLKKIGDEIINSITANLLLRALKKLEPNIRKYILVLDNVDRLPKEYQPICYDFALTLNNDVKSYVKVVICIREENAHIPLDTFGHQSELTDRVILSKKLTRKKFSYLPMEDFYKILFARQQFCFDNIQNHKSLKGLIELITRSMIDHYSEYLLVDIANQSIRNALEYHCLFVENLLTNFNHKILRQTLESPSKESFLTSFFLGWIVDSAEVVTEHCLNLTCLKSDFYLKPSVESGCDLNYLILTNLFNNAISERVTTITFKQLIDNFSILSFSEEHIKEQLYELYSYKGKHFGHIVSIINDEIVNSINDINDNTKISVNFRGKSLVEPISRTFTFINRMQYKTSDYEMKDKVLEIPGKYYALKSYRYHSINHLKLIADIATIHNVELCQIAKKINKPNWLSIYMRKFGVNGQLQLERIIPSTRKFLEAIASRLEDSDDSILISEYCAILDCFNKIYSKATKDITPSTDFFYDYPKILTHLLQTYGKRRFNDFWEKGTYKNYKSNINEFILSLQSKKW